VHHGYATEWRNLELANITTGREWLCSFAKRCAYLIQMHNSYCWLAGIALSVWRLATGWTVRRSYSGGGKIFRTRPDWSCDPPYLLYNCYRVSLGRFTHSMPLPCRSPAMPCRQLFRMCLSHLIYTVRPCLIHTCHAMPMLCSDHAVLLKVTAQHGRRQTACGLPARVRLLPATMRSSTKIVIRSIRILLTTIHT